MVFGLGLLWAWLNIPIPIYGTLWLLALAYFTVMLPLGVRTLAGVVLQIDKSLEECARVCGASWAYQMRTITLPLLKPAIVVALLFRTILAFKVFDEVYLLTSGGPGTSTELVTLHLYKVFFEQNQLGYGALLSLALIAAILAFLLVARQATRAVRAA